MRKTLAALAILPLAACGGRLSQTDTQKGFAAISEALSGGLVSATASADSSGKVSGLSIACAGGGTVAMSGTVSTSVTTESLTVTFAGCDENGIMMTGTLTASGNASGSDGSETCRVKASGTIDFSGSLSGSCDVDITETVTGSSNGASGTFSGTVCGNNASTMTLPGS